MSDAARSFLFVPGDRPDRFGKAAESGADRVILDLEDAVAPAAKAEARVAVHRWADSFGRSVVVRINAGDTPWFAEDLAMVASLAGADVMVPKSEPEAVEVAAGQSGRPLIALVETVTGLMRLRETLACPQVTRAAFGNLDFGVDSGMSCEGGGLDPVRTQIVLESRFADKPPPIDGVTVALTDEEELLRDLDRAKRLGFGAKLCIHPRQVAAVNRRLRPSDAETAWAARVLEAAETSGGAAIAVDGKMVDRPVLQRARAILAQAR